MEVLLRDLGSSETPIRLIAIEKVAQKLENKNWLRDVAGDVRMKVMSFSVNYVKDANPKIVSIALGCLNLLILNYRDDFQPLVNMSFEILLVKLGDAKVSIREQALDVTTHLVELLGVASTFERIMTNITTKNQRLKENLLCLVSRMQASHGSEIKETVSASVMCSTLSSVLNDPQSSLRQLAVTTLANLYPVYGEDLVNALSACEMRAAQQKALLEAIYEQRQRLQSGPVSFLSSTGTGASHRTASTKPSGLASTMTAASKSIKTAPVRSLSTTKRRPTLSATALGSTGAADLPNFHGTCNSIGSAASNASSTISNADSAGGEGGEGNKPSSAFDPAGFMNFIQLKNSAKPTEIVDEKDLQRLFGKISTDLAKKSDWEARASALIALQKLAWGNVSDFKVAIDHIKSIHELISAQIIDLRSAVSKEACRAVGALAASLRQHFTPLAELFWPHLARVVVVKIQVIASAADKCLRVLVAACPDHRLLGLIVESCTGKNPPLRKLCLEYACLACAAWRSEGIERQVAQLKQVVRTAIADSDAGARKTARQLFWVLHDISPTVQGQMKTMLHDLDPASQRYIQAEAVANTAELNDLLSIRQNPACLMGHAQRITTSELSAHHKEGIVHANVQKEREMHSIPMPPAPTRMIESTCAAVSMSAPPVPAQQQEHEEEMISEFDCLMQEEEADRTGALTDRRASTSSTPSWNPAVTGTALKSSRRLSLTAGPQRIIHNQQQQPVEQAPIEAHHIAEPRSSSSSSLLGATSRRLSLAGASRTVPKAGSDLSQRRYEDEEETAAIHTSVPQFSTQTPAPKASTRSSLLSMTASRTVMPSAAEEGAFASQDACNSLPGLELGVTGFATTARSSRRASLGSTLSTADVATSSGATTSALANGPKRIIRPAPSIPAEHIPQVTAPSLPQPSGEAMLNAIPSKRTGEDADAPVFIFSAETLRTMLEDSQWSVKVKALESMHARLQRASDSGEVLSDDLVGSFVDLCLPVLGDPHHRVATDALQVLQGSVASFPKQVTSRVGATTLALFHRLADRRQNVREVANSVLNLVRTNIDGPVIMAALSPRMGEVPDRMKTALMQFMGAIAPHCEEYFSQGNHAWAFLSRLAGVIGGGNVKPSATLTVAARRLLELVYRAAPTVVCSQMAALPFQQQLLLKKFLEASVPDIESQVMAASKADWASKSAIPSRDVASSNSNSKHSSELIQTTTPHVDEEGLEEEDAVVIQAEEEEAISSVSYASESLPLAPAAVNVTPSKTPVKVSSDLNGGTSMNSSTVAEVVTESVLPMTPPPVSPALRLSSKQKLSSTRRPDSADLRPASPSDVPSVPAYANPFSSPPPPPTETPPSIRPRQMSPAALDLEVRVLEYMEAARHSQSPSENVSPNSPADYASSSAADLALSSGSPSRSGSKKSLSSFSSSALLSTAPYQSVASPLYANHNEAIANAVLASKIAIDKATEEIIERYSPSKGRSPVKPSLSPELNRDTSTSSSLQSALLAAYGVSHPPTAAETPSRPSMLPQRSRANSINNTSSSNGKSLKESASPAGSDDHNTAQLAQAYGTPAKTSRAPVGTSTPSSSSRKSITTTPSSATGRSPHPTPTAPKLASYTPPQQGLSVPQDTKASPAGAKARDAQWLLENLKPTATLTQREEAHKELKHRVKTADDVYWLQNYAQIVTVLLESLRPSASVSFARTAPPSSPSPSSSLAGFEQAEMSTKALLVLSRYRGNHLKNLMEILVDRLCYAASFCPLPLTQSFEVILSEFAKYDAPRLVRALLPYASCTPPGSAAEGAVGESPQVRLTALRVVCNSIRFFASAQLLSQLSTLIPAVLTSINSPLADLRKAVVFILVEVYLSVGDSVFPHIHSLTPPQRKLMTIYVEKRMNERKHVVAAALT